MADEQTPQSSTDEQPTSGEEPQEEQSGASTLEEVEAYWRKRQSNSDKAHEAERRELQRRLESLEGQRSSGESGESGTDEVQSRVLKEMQERLSKAEARATQAELKAEFPLAVQELGDAAVHVSRERLAALNERLDFDASVPKRIDSNNPARQAPSGPKSVEDMSLDELKEYFRGVPYEG